MSYPTLHEITAAAGRLSHQVLRTPVWRWQTGAIADVLDERSEVWLKLALFQQTGTFKVRGALNSVDAMDRAARRRGVVAEVILAPDIHAAFEHGSRIESAEARTMVHPYDGPLIAQGTATLGLELAQQIPELDAVVVPVGGGGLCGGIAAAIKQVRPSCAVYGVEPVGADAMYRSFRAGRPERLERVASVADSLGAPYALQYSYDVCRRFVDDIVRVTDDEICRAMRALYHDMKLVAEPAAATATAALFGPLRNLLRGRRVALLVCGSNIDPGRFAELVARGAPACAPT